MTDAEIALRYLERSNHIEHVRGARRIRKALAALRELVRLKQLKELIEQATGVSVEHVQRVREYEARKGPAWDTAKLAADTTMHGTHSTRVTKP